MTTRLLLLALAAALLIWAYKGFPPILWTPAPCSPRCY